MTTTDTRTCSNSEPHASHIWNDHPLVKTDHHVFHCPGVRDPLAIRRVLPRTPILKHAIT